MPLNICDRKVVLYPCSAADSHYNAEILEVLRLWACTAVSNLFVIVTPGVTPPLDPADPATIPTELSGGDYIFEFFDDGVIVWQNDTLLGNQLVVKRTFGGSASVVRHTVDIVNGDTIVLPSATSKEKVVYVEINDQKVDHIDEAIAGFSSWAIAGDTITLSDTVTYKTARVAYLS